MPERGTAFVTGASAGIGAAAAEALARHGYNVFLAGRAADRLASAVDELSRRYGRQRFQFAAFDVRHFEAMQSAVAQAEQALGPIDLLVTSAGIGMLDFLDRLDPDDGVRAQIDTNLTGSILAVRAALPSMMARRSGGIILVGSLAGLVASPTYSIYAATKFGLAGFADALRREVGVWGIRVSLFLPGAVDTGFAEASVVRRRTRMRTPRSWLLSAEETGEAISRLAEHPRRRWILPRRMRPVLWLAQVWPGLVDWTTRRFFVERERADELRGDSQRGSGEPSQRP
jgi:short-subunit dehydrogenase